MKKIYRLLSERLVREDKEKFRKRLASKFGYKEGDISWEDEQNESYDQEELMRWYWKRKRRWE